MKPTPYSCSLPTGAVTIPAADPVRGFARDAAFDHAGFANVLALRGEAEGRALRPPESYVDLSYYRQALAGLWCVPRG